MNKSHIYQVDNKIKRLDQLFNELSEEYWSAGWLFDLDVHLWLWMNDENSPLKPEHREELKRLSSETGHWIWWPENKINPVSVPLDFWRVEREDKIAELSGTKVTST